MSEPPPLLAPPLPWPLSDPPPLLPDEEPLQIHPSVAWDGQQLWVTYNGVAPDADLEMAARLVVDTGLHHKRWSREQARQFLHVPIWHIAVRAHLDIEKCAPKIGIIGGELKIAFGHQDQAFDRRRFGVYSDIDMAPPPPGQQ